MPEPLLTLDTLSKAFGAHQVLDGVDVTINRGEIVGLLGPNGSGKSTLLNAISGFMAPDGGTVAIAGRDITGLPAHRVTQAGLARTFQLPAMPSRMTVRDVLRAADTDAGTARRMLRTPARDSRVDRLLLTFRLSRVADLPASSLSGGQKKLLSVALAMRGAPELLCLDEPTAGVHPELRSEMVSALKAANRQGTTLLVIEHDMLFIRQLCTRCIVLDRGKLIADCAPEELEHNPAVVEAYLGKAIEKGKTAR
ncbi:ABC transporter ATP-binding protein [Pseudooceanicola sp. LIPI14-2-Ac024]|uniref:ABC transporter ATP-binding protein n=1 Tax=Pseudooceanicola sp. LIPI14-2-Ac024 TaxID=3344875 RepID=UPI0035D07641